MSAPRKDTSPGSPAPEGPPPDSPAVDVGALAARIAAGAEEPHLIVDGAGRIVWSNAAFRRLWRGALHPGADGTPGRLADLLVPGADPAMLPYLQDIATGRVPVRLTEVELAFRAPASCRLRFVGEADPAGGGVLLYTTRVAEGAGELQRQFQAAIEALDDGFALYDADDRLVMANARYREFFSYCSHVMHPGVRFETILREGLAKGMPPEAIGREEEWLARKLDEHRAGVGWFERRLGDRWLRIFERRTPAGWHVALRMDISPIKAREVRLAELHRLAQERLELLDTVLDNIDVGVHYFDEAFRLRYGNAALFRMLDIPQGLFGIGASFEEMLRLLWDRGDYGARPFAEVLDERLDRLRLPAFHHVEKRSSGRVIEGAGQVLPSGGRVTTYRDVTDEHRLREDLEAARDAAEGASRAKSDFLATMSHEIRTPLNGVLGMAAALAETDLDAGQRRMLDVVVNSGTVLQALLSDLLDMAQAEAGELAILEKPYRAVEIVEPLSAVHRRHAAERGLSVAVTLSEAAGGVRLGDPLRLRQVLDNLLSNALKVTEAGGVTVEVDAATPPSSGEGAATEVPGLRFVVADTGPGISQEDQKRLFLPFSRLDVSFTRETGGSGLGLAICRRLVEAMGGTIDLHSAPGAGTRVEVVVPAPQAAPGTPTQAARRAAEPVPEMPRGLRVLVAEDIPSNRLVLTHLLNASGAEVRTVGDGAEAVAAARAGDLDVILMDVMMPRLDGVAATRAIRADEARCAAPRVPIVALTANAMPQDAESYLAAGMDAHVSKPIDPAAMRTTIARIVARAASRDPGAKGGA